MIVLTSKFSLQCLHLIYITTTVSMADMGWHYSVVSKNYISEVWTLLKISFSLFFCSSNHFVSFSFTVVREKLIRIISEMCETSLRCLFIYFFLSFQPFLENLRDCCFEWRWDLKPTVVSIYSLVQGPSDWVHSKHLPVLQPHLSSIGHLQVCPDTKGLVFLGANYMTSQ